MTFARLRGPRSGASSGTRLLSVRSDTGAWVAPVKNRGVTLYRPARTPAINTAAGPIDPVGTPERYGYQ